ncbi:MAG: hypothetical protein ACRDT8_01180 [Micromonosporaceae bacterium]
MTDIVVDSHTVDSHVPEGLVHAIKKFAAAHQGAQAVVEYEPKRGARIVITGKDGASVQGAAPATDIARDACRQAGVQLVNTWEQEMFADIRQASA